LKVANSVGSVLEKRYLREAKLYEQMTDRLVPQLNGANQAIISAALDDELGNFEHLFKTILANEGVIDAVYYRLYSRLTTYFNLRGLYAEQINWAVELIKRITSDSELVDVSLLNSIALSYDQIGAHQEALTLYDFILNEFTDQPDHPGLGVIHFNTSLSHHHLGNTAKAIKHCRKAIELETLHEHGRGMVMSMIFMAQLAHDIGDINACFDYLQQTMTVAEQINDDAYLQAYCTGMMAFLTAEYAPPPRTETIFREAIRQWEHLNEPTQLAMVYFNYAGFLHALERYEESLKYARKSLKLYEVLGTYHVKIVRDAISEWLLD
jgi:tetratricopeptide (TPR) repeat protein